MKDIQNCGKYISNIESIFDSEKNLYSEIFSLFANDDLKHILSKALLLSHYHCRNDIFSRSELKKCLIHLLNEPEWNPWSDPEHLRLYLRCGSGYLNNDFLDTEIWKKVRSEAMKYGVY